MEQEIRFCTTQDGVRLAYAVMGEGPPVILVPTWANSIELDADYAEGRAFQGELCAGPSVDHLGLPEHRHVATRSGRNLGGDSARGSPGGGGGARPPSVSSRCLRHWHPDRPRVCRAAPGAGLASRADGRLRRPRGHGCGAGCRDSIHRPHARQLGPGGKGLRQHHVSVRPG